MLPPIYGSFPQSSSAQQQPQLGMNNPQVTVPFNGNNNYVGMNVPNQPGFVNGPNNNLRPHLGAPPHLGPQQGKPHMGFGPVRGQGFGLANVPQFNPNMNMNMNPFGQFCVPNGLPGMNQFGQMPMQMQMLMPMPNLPPPQFGLGNSFGVMNHPQFGNLHYSAGQINPNPNPNQNQNQHNMGMPAMPVVAPNAQVNSCMDVPGSVQTDQANQSFAGNGNPSRPGGFNGSRGNWRGSPGKNFGRNSNRGKFQNSQFNHMRNGRKNFGSPNSHNGRGLSDDVPGNFANGTFKNQGSELKKRRPLSLVYTEQEIRQWREERRKNYPSKGNVEKKLTEKKLNRENLRKEAEERRERLKEILAKQAELGVEVAEIPGYLLSDPKKQNREVGENERPFNRKGKGRFRNKFDKRGRFDRQDNRFSKRQRPNEDASSNAPPASKKEPTLLQKLLSSDIKRDNRYLLQAFRFMVLNSFFDSSANGRPLRFPSVIVKDGSEANDMDGETGLSPGKDVAQVDDSGDDKDSEDDDESCLKSCGDKGVDDDDDDDEDEDGEIH